MNKQNKEAHRTENKIDGCQIGEELVGLGEGIKYKLIVTKLYKYQSTTSYN